ncbi:MAG: hypothetical protein Q8P01_02265 [bacterium]|nr:hypothetical protein [bacterium]
MKKILGIVIVLLIIAGAIYFGTRKTESPATEEEGTGITEEATDANVEPGIVEGELEGIDTGDIEGELEGIDTDLQGL